MPRLHQLGDGGFATRSVHPDDANGVREHAEGGGLYGSPLWNCSLELLPVALAEPLPGEVALRYAAADAFNKVLQAAGVMLLEPIMEVEVNTPPDHLGDIINDLQQRRAVITNQELAETRLCSMPKRRFRRCLVIPWRCEASARGGRASPWSRLSTARPEGVQEGLL